MSISKRIAFGAAASWFGRGVSILLGLVLMPVLFRHLPKEELGVWLLLGQSWAALGIFDLGFGVTLTRRIAFAKGKSGADPNAPLSAETINEIADLIATGKRIYHTLSVFAFLFSFIAGFLYLRGVHLSTLTLSQVWLAWGLLCISQALGVWANIWNCLLLGVGYVGWDNVLSSLVSILTLAVQILVAMKGGGLIGLAAVAAIGSVSQRFLLLGFARNRRPELFKIQGHWHATVFRSMLPLALKAWATAIGTVVVTQTDQFFVVSLRGPAELPIYRAAYLILLNINMLSVTVAGASSVFISHLWQAKQIEKVKRLVIRNLRLGMSIMACGAACVLALGPQLFDFWLRPGHFIGYPILSVFVVFLILEVQCFIISTCSRATEDEAFAIWTVASGGLKLLFSGILGMRYGLIGIALGTLLAQLCTNHWYMPYRGLKRLEIKLSGHIRHVILPVSIVFLVTGIIVWAVTTKSASWPPWISVASGITAAGVILCVSLWMLVLDRSQRKKCVLGLGLRASSIETIR